MPIDFVHPENSSKFYDLRWAEITYYAFIHTYVRATQLFHLIHPIKQGTIILWVAGDQDKWEKYKKIIKRVDKWDKKHNCAEISHYPKQVLSTIDYALSREYDFYLATGK